METQTGPRTAAPPQLQLVHIFLAHLTPSPLNPARRQPTKAMIESVKTFGVHTPIDVLPPDGKGIYEILGGHRRFAAAKAAGVKSVPAIVRYGCTREDWGQFEKDKESIKGQHWLEVCCRNNGKVEGVPPQTWKQIERCVALYGTFAEVHKKLVLNGIAPAHADRVEEVKRLFAAYGVELPAPRKLSEWILNHRMTAAIHRVYLYVKYETSPVAELRRVARFVNKDKPIPRALRRARTKGGK